MKKLNNKGFTLIEMVIVIVVIAILAAMLVPSLLAYADNANEKKLLTAADTIQKCVTTEIADLYKDGTDVEGSSAENPIYDDDFWGRISSSANVEVGEISSSETATYFVEFTITSGKISQLSVSSKDKTANLVGSTWEVENRD